MIKKLVIFKCYSPFQSERYSMAWPSQHQFELCSCYRGHICYIKRTRKEKLTFSIYNLRRKWQSFIIQIESYLNIWSHFRFSTSSSFIKCLYAPDLCKAAISNISITSFNKKIGHISCKWGAYTYSICPYFLLTIEWVVSDDEKTCWR